MEAVPRLPMISFELKVSTESVSFSSALKEYIFSYYHEDPEAYNAEIINIESLRNAAVRPTIDVSGCQLMKKYYCQLHYLKSRFPMHELQQAAIFFSWKDTYSSLTCSVQDIRYELMCILYNIGALHSQLGASDTRTTSEGMRMACTHFQCAAWAFQTLKESYYEMVAYISSVDCMYFMQQVCLAQAQECILEKSMMDNRKATIIAKVAVQIVDYYKKALAILQNSSDESTVSESVGNKTQKEWIKYLLFKISYHKCIALLFQGQQAEEQQKMGERVAFYQAASDQLEEARKLATNLKQQRKEVEEALAFTSDVVEGKRKAAKNENEFIYHEEVPNKEALQEVQGAPLVKGISFSFTDPEISGPDIFARLVPMETHETSSLYSERKAQMLRQVAEIIESKDQALAEFMSSMQLDVISQMRQAVGLPQDLIDRVAAISVKPSICQDLITTMGQLSNSYQEVESMLNEINELLLQEEQQEKQYQELMGKRPPSIIATDLAREATKYKEAHTKANDSNENLHKAMTTNVANLKVLSQPISQLQQQIPSIELPNPNIDDEALKELEMLIAKVEEMRTQRAMLWTQFREAVHNDDITNVLITKPADQPLDVVFEQELQKHQKAANYIEQNALAQETIIKRFVDIYAQTSSTRRYLQDILNKRNSAISALISSYDSYEDLLIKANKGIDFYNKLETNVSKLLQRIKSACKVQQEEREQMLANHIPKSDALVPSNSTLTTHTAPKLKDYLESRKKISNVQYPIVYPTNLSQDMQGWPSGARPAPLGSEVNNDNTLPRINEVYPNNASQIKNADDVILSNRLATLRTNDKLNYTQYNYSVSDTGTICPNQSLVGGMKSNEMLTTSVTTTTTFTNLNYQNYYSNQFENYPESSYYNSGASKSYYGNDFNPSHQITSVHSKSEMTNPVNFVSNFSLNSMDSNSNKKPNTSILNNYLSTNNTNYGYSTSMNPFENSPGPIPQNYSLSKNVDSTVIYSPAGNTSVQMSVTNPQMDLNNSYQNLPQFNQTTSTSDYNSMQTNLSSTQIYQNTSLYPNGQQQFQQDIYQNHNQIDLHNKNVPQSYINTTLNYQNVASTYSYPIDSHYYTTQPTYQMSNLNYSQINYPTDTTQSCPSAGLMATSQSHQVNQTDLSQNFPQYTTYDQYYKDNTSYNQCSDTSKPLTTTMTSSQSFAISTATKESNVDLLSGLDFTISQAPLIPQQNTIQTKEKTQQLPQQLKSDDKNLQKTKSFQPQHTNEMNSTSSILSSIINQNIDRKPLNNSEMKALILQELEKYEKFVDTLSNKTLNGPTNLDLKWKEIQDKQDSDGVKKAISVARCYPMKNRCPDILPYDGTRVELKNAKDDYINASYIQQVSLYGPSFIVTQTPFSSTFSDFWTMIWEQQVEIIICMLNTNEIINEIYWPQEKGKDLHFSDKVISLISENVKTNYIERLFSISLPEKHESRVIIHLQFTSWAESLFPTCFEPIVNFINEILNLYYQQRQPHHPVVVHCYSGIGRSGLICLLLSAIIELTNNPTSIPDLVAITLKLTACRKNLLRDREHLKFAFVIFQHFMKQLVEEGQTKKLNDSSVKIKKDEGNENIQDYDPLSQLDPFWANKK